MRISVNNWDIEVLAVYEISKWQFGVEVLQVRTDAIHICWLINADVQLMHRCNYNHIRSLVAIETTKMFYFVAININTSPYNICKTILVAQNMCVALPYWEIVISSLFLSYTCEPLLKLWEVFQLRDIFWNLKVGQLLLFCQLWLIVRAVDIHVLIMAFQLCAWR